jgi:eukaryotic-like serine/threonine-protein kinase
LSPVDKNRLDDDARVGRVLSGRFRLQRLIGHGGMGSVYEGVHVHTEKRIAVKLLSASLSKDLKLVARFVREAKAASLLEHENCVHVDDFGEDDDGTFYIVMELVEGHGLADELRKSGPLAWQRVAHIGAQLLKALDAAHSAGVLHRDLKPQNVMLTHKPSRPDIVKVVDFGIAKITTSSAEDQAALTVPGTIFGTPEYMSPEQARGEVLDARSDLYSASVVLWHMLLGRSPFRGSSVRETLMKVFAEEPPRPSEERPGSDIPRAFEDVLKTGMAKRREDRFADAGAYLEALRPFLPGDVVLPRRPAPGLAKDGAPPPSTIDDNPQRAVTLALPDQAADLADAETRFGALATVALPAAPWEASRSAGATERPTPVRSGAAAVVLTFAAVGLAAVVGLGAWLLRSDSVVARADAGVAALGDAGSAPAVLPPDAGPDPVARDEALRRAERAIAQQDYQGAIGAYEDAIAADPTSAKAHLGRATVAMTLRDWPTARDRLASARALDPEYRDKLAGMYARAKQLAEKPAQD